jgi:hypothetical protein
MNLSDAYIRFFKGISGHPKLKKKKNAKKAFPLRSDGVYFRRGCIVVSKIGTIKYKTDYCLPDDKKTKIRIWFIDLYNAEKDNEEKSIKSLMNELGILT